MRVSIVIVVLDDADCWDRLEAYDDVVNSLFVPEQRSGIIAG